MFQAVRRNFGLKLRAIALAVTAWAYFHYSAAPSITAHFDQELSVPIAVTGLPPGLVAELTEHAVTVTLEAPRNGPPVKVDQVAAVVDISGRTTPGILNIPLKIVAPDLAIKSISPASVTLTVDRLATRAFPVTISYSGRNAGLVVASARVEPEFASVRGITTELAKVAVVRIDVPLGSKPGELDAMVRPAPVDATGGEVPALQVAPNLVRVHVRFSPATNSAGVKQ